MRLDCDSKQDDLFYIMEYVIEQTERQYKWGFHSVQMEPLHYICAQVLWEHAVHSSLIPLHESTKAL